MHSDLYCVVEILLVLLCKSVQKVIVLKFLRFLNTLNGQVWIATRLLAMN